MEVTNGLSMAERRRRNFEEIASKVKGKPRCTECMCFLTETDICGGEDTVKLCSYCRNTGIFRLRQKINTAERDGKPKLSKLPGIHGTEEDDKTNDQTTHTYTSPLNYLGYYTGRHRRRLSATVRKLPTMGADVTNAGEDSSNTKVPGMEKFQAKRMDLTRVAIPVSLRNNEVLKNKGMYCPTILFERGENPKWSAKLSDVLPMLYFPISGENTTKSDTGAAKPVVSPTPDVVKSFQSRAHKR